MSAKCRWGTFFVHLRFERDGDFLDTFTKLKLNKEFKRAYGRGRSYVHPAFVTYVLPNRSGNCRIGITTSKKIGCAVQRNRARRVITAAFRSCVPDITSGCDIVFVARRRAVFSKSTSVAAAMAEHLEKAGVLRLRQ